MLPAFWIAFFLILIGEMGDKTQLVALAFANRYSIATIMGGVSGATLLVHLFSVLIGQVLGFKLPIFWINIITGLAFIGFGLWTLRGDELDEEEQVTRISFGPLLTVGITFFLAKMVDKTILATVTVAS